MPIWKMTHAVTNRITFEVIASRVAGSDLPDIVNQKEVIMTNVVPVSRALRLALLAGAVASGASAALLVAGAGFLESWLSLTVTLMHEAGLVPIPYLMFVIFVALRPTPFVGAVNTIVAINLAWTAAKLLLLMSGWVAPTLLGIAFALTPGLVVGAIGVIQYGCLRQTCGTAKA
jgi:hypothetical protein